jgi:adenylosuccinate lyase
MANLSELTAVSPLDGRYRAKVEKLDEYMSEYALIKSRVHVEGALLIALTSGALPDVPPIGGEAHKRIQWVIDDFSVAQAQEVKDLEAVTNHDVKAVELWLRAQFENDPVIGHYLELIHFGVTSEDINNNAYNLMVDGATKDVIIPGLDKISANLSDKAIQFADIPMLGETHGQAATPTTVGKELRVFANRFEKSTTALSEIELTGKLNGATGTYGAMVIAYPEVNWPQFSEAFVRGLGFDFNGVTTQIEPHDQLAALFDQLSRTNGIIKDTSMDMWEYISRAIFKLRPKAGETGSSTMPHKVNPIDFENAEGNAGVSTAILRFMSDKLVVSRLQRDLSDSTVLRATGEGFGHMEVAINSLLRGLGKIDANADQAATELGGEWAVLAEAVQTVGRRYNEDDIYNKIKEAVRGKPLDREGYLALIDTLKKVPEEALERLRALTPDTSIGLAPQIAREEV